MLWSLFLLILTGKWIALLAQYFSLSLSFFLAEIIPVSSGVTKELGWTVCINTEYWVVYLIFLNKEDRSIGIWMVDEGDFFFFLNDLLPPLVEWVQGHRSFLTDVSLVGSSQ